LRIYRSDNMKLNTLEQIESKFFEVFEECIKLYPPHVSIIRYRIAELKGLPYEYNHLVYQNSETDMLTNATLEALFSENEIDYSIIMNNIIDDAAKYAISRAENTIDFDGTEDELRARFGLAFHMFIKYKDQMNEICMNGIKNYLSFEYDAGVFMEIMAMFGYKLENYINNTEEFDKFLDNGCKDGKITDNTHFELAKLTQSWIKNNIDTVNDVLHDAVVDTSVKLGDKGFIDKKIENIFSNLTKSEYTYECMYDSTLLTYDILTDMIRGNKDIYGILINTVLNILLNHYRENQKED